jgi:hypothetical protein
MTKPSIYTKELANQVLEGLAQGKSIRNVLGEVGIAWETWRKWLIKRPDLRESYNQAKEDGIEWSLSEVEDIAKGVVSRSQNEKMDMANVKAVDTFIKHKQWMASKLAAKKYGDKAQMEIGNIKDQSFSIKWDK